MFHSFLSDQYPVLYIFSHQNGYQIHSIHRICSHSAASFSALAGVLSGFGLPLMLSLGVANSLA
nr:hypothetical protein [Bacillus subtilis]